MTRARSETLELEHRAHAPTLVFDPMIGSTRRDRILSAALELFAVRGYRSTTMGDLGELAGIRGPSIYKHFKSKQEILAELMFATMDRLIDRHQAALAASDDVVERLELAVEAHVRYHARYRFEAFMGTREINSLEEPARSLLLARRDTYERGFRTLIETGQSEGKFNVTSSRLASYAILDMGMGVAVWFRDTGPINEDEVVHHYAGLALRMVGAPE
jgi:AcrR family transcriptional regulator